MASANELPGAPCWADVMSPDIDATRAFYGQLFGWTAEPPNEEFGGYANFTKDGALVAGSMAATGPNDPNAWTIYLRAADTRATVDRAVANGGRVIAEPMDVGDLGTMAVVSDAGGAVVGLWQPGAHPGFGVRGEPGSPSWFELHTRDYDASVAFYRDVLGWDTHVASDEEGFRYTTLGEGDDAQAGIMDAAAFLPDGVPANWSVYFEVQDVDAALAKTTELGGSVVMPGEDTPYGRLAQAVDPTGATFKLRSSP